MKIISLMMAVIVSFVVLGCDKRASYDAMMQNQKINCRNYEGEAKRKCLENSDMSYDIYQKSLGYD
jgi:uncharacterized lipoprotein NlpE involved in copper resistance